MGCAGAAGPQGMHAWDSKPVGVQPAGVGFLKHEADNEEDRGKEGGEGLFACCSTLGPAGHRGVACRSRLVTCEVVKSCWPQSGGLGAATSSVVVMTLDSQSSHCSWNLCVLHPVDSCPVKAAHIIDI